MTYKQYSVSSGGSWYYYSETCRVAFRNFCTPASHYNFIGFRLTKKFKS